MKFLLRIIDRLLPSQEELAVFRTEMLRNARPNRVVIGKEIYERRNGYLHRVTAQYQTNR